MNDPEADPWASPALHKGHTHPVDNEATPHSNGVTAAVPITNKGPMQARTTSAFTTHSERPDSATPANGGEALSGAPAGSSGWDSYDHNSGFQNPDQSGLGNAGFGSGGDDQGDPNQGAIRRSLGGGRTSSRPVEEIVTITMLPGKEGMFMFQHRNYEVKSVRRASSVVRRYSDFVWLLDCLHKRYPFRQLPLLPPKTLAGKLLLSKSMLTILIVVSLIS